MMNARNSNIVTIMRIGMTDFSRAVATTQEIKG